MKIIALVAAVRHPDLRTSIAAGAAVRISPTLKEVSVNGTTIRVRGDKGAARR